jgi:hypothetical protein
MWSFSISIKYTPSRGVGSTCNAVVFPWMNYFPQEYDFWDLYKPCTLHLWMDIAEVLDLLILDEMPPRDVFK